MSWHVSWHEFRYSAFHGTVARQHRKLASGALRVRVYAGIDPVTKRRHTLTEVIEPGPKAAERAEKARIALLNQVDEQRNPRTKATVAQLLERHLKMLDVVPTTLSGYRGYVKHHIKPLIGDVKVDALDAETLDSFYAELRLCQHHCRGRSYIQHRTSGTHTCDARCAPHRCEGLSAATVRQISTSC